MDKSTEPEPERVRRLALEGRTEEALAICRVRIASDPGDMKFVVLFAAVAMKVRAEPEEVEAVLARALEIVPGHYMASSLLAFLLYRAGRVAESIPHLQCAADRGKDAQLLAILGQAHLDRGNPRASEEAFERSLALDPSGTDALCGLAQLAIERRDAARARAFAEQALALDGDSGRAHELAGQALWLQRDYSAAEQAFRKAIEREPARVWAYCFLGYLLIATDRLEQAQLVLRRALERSPAIPLLQEALADAYLRSGQLNRASAAYSESLGLDPFSARANLGYGVTLSDQGLRKQAKDYLKRALLLGLKGDYRRFALEELGDLKHRP